MIVAQNIVITIQPNINIHDVLLNCESCTSAVIKYVKCLYQSVAAVVFAQVDLALQDFLCHAHGLEGSVEFQLDTQRPVVCVGFPCDRQGPGASWGLKCNTLLESISWRETKTSVYMRCSTKRYNQMSVSQILYIITTLAYIHQRFKTRWQKLYIVILLKAYFVIFQVWAMVEFWVWCVGFVWFQLLDGETLILTCHPDTLSLVSFIPCFQLAGPGTVEDLAAAATCSQLHGHRATTLIAELNHWFPEKRLTQLETGSC